MRRRTGDPALGFAYLGNPDLKPEESQGYDVGFEQPLFNDRLRFGSTYFHNNITNLITKTLYDPVMFNYIETNVGLATTEGTENFVSAKITDRFSVRADYTYTRAVDAILHVDLVRRPKEKWSATAIWLPTDQFTLSATVLHVGSWMDYETVSPYATVLAPGYTVVNLNGDYAVTGQVKLFARVDNLFNEHYQNPLGYLAPGLGVFGGIRVATYVLK